MKTAIILFLLGVGYISAIPKSTPDRIYLQADYYLKGKLQKSVDCGEFAARSTDKASVNSIQQFGNPKIEYVNCDSTTFKIVRTKLKPEILQNWK